MTMAVNGRDKTVTDLQCMHLAPAFSEPKLPKVFGNQSY